jgi:hypothetical protein
MDLHRLIADGNPDIRQLSLRLLPLVPYSPENESVVIRALSDKMRSTALEAVVAAGKLRIEAAIPGLTHFLKWGDQELSRAAADALADIPPKGWEVLQEFGPPRGGTPPATATPQPAAPVQEATQAEEQKARV